MKTWRIHFGWAIVTVLVAGVATKVASQREPAAPHGAIRPPGPIRETPPAETDGRKPEAIPEAPGEVPLPAAAPVAEAPLRDRLRALLRNPRNWNDLTKMMEGPEDRDLKLAVLKEELFGTDQQGMFSAIYALRSMKGREVAQILESYLTSHLTGGSGDASSVAEALGEVGDPGSLAPLTEALRSKNEDVRYSSAEALEKLGYAAPAEEMMGALLRQFESPDGGLRRRAIERMSQLSTTRAIPVLTRGLKDSNGDVRLAAVQAFYSVRGRDYLPLVEPLVNDPNPEVAKEAQDLVEELKGREP